ncbi:hypothetical protein IL306_005371 [Fusarium sp. DS 682]|nr:hypothetical protein IL306_005371 [Fusarium sp. DS 682]
MARSTSREPSTQLLRALRSGISNQSEYWSWFERHLAAKFDGFPEEYTTIGGRQSSGNKITFPKFNLIAGAIYTYISNSERDQVTLQEIATELGQSQLVSVEEEKTPNIKQFIFTTIGLLSKLYTPSFNYSKGYLLIDVPSSSSNRCRATVTWAESEQTLPAGDESIGDIIKRFSNSRGPFQYSMNSLANPAEINTLIAANLCYFTFSRLGSLSIQWTDSVCMHLELNRKERTIKMFRFPSLCAIIAQSQNQSSFLDQLFKDCLDGSSEAQDGESLAVDFYYEVLLTFRLIFGQNKRSWSLMKKKGSVPRLGKKEFNSDVDPLLYGLCCQDWDDEPLYDKIHAPAARSAYSARQDFPFFSERLILL